ncbi:hypothetical protein [uncultured Draconibacterium sp.]|uniref:hypothetical protein n=1 Tax=uncultured Draconibacterium sp. TaxID=1573823 RepID=UPI0032167747
MKKTILILSILVFTYSTFAQDTPTELIEKFFTTYKNDAGKAVKDLYKTNKWTERIQDDIENVANKVDAFNESLMGKYYGYEIITSKKFAESFVLYSYLIKYDRQPLRFTFKFYKPNDKWILYAFQFDDSLDDEIEEAAKLYYLDLENN